MEYFVSKDSIVRKIWGRADTVLFIFAGAAAEFALNKAVDWLYFTGRLPADPLGRLFSTVVYARRIIFSELNEANHAIDQITHIHQTVEQNRGAQIPAWAYRDVLFMLIWYSIRSFEVLYRDLNDEEKEEVFNTFYRVGSRMGLKDLPVNYKDWLVAHAEHLQNDIAYSNFTTDLYKQYRKHLGFIRFKLLKEVQALITPEKVNQLLLLGNPVVLMSIMRLYKLSRMLKINNFLIERMLPAVYQAQIKEINKAAV